MYNGTFLILRYSFILICVLGCTGDEPNRLTDFDSFEMTKEAKEFFATLEKVDETQREALNRARPSFASSSLPGWTDTTGSLSRRLVVSEFTTKPQK